ncbi:hypothetical protein ACFW04_011341 [Cataglyphis niger]
MATAHFNFKLSRFRCDNGREYLYTPEQNGMAERLNRTICEKARCLLLNSELNKSFWSDAIRTAVSTFFGLAYLHLPKQPVVGKFDSRTLPCLMIDYITNGYKLDIKFDETKFRTTALETELRLSSEEIRKEDIKTNVESRMDACDDSSEDEFYSAENEGVILSIQNAEENFDKGPHLSTHKISKPKFLDDYAVIVYSAETYLAETFEEINSREDKEAWLQAVNEEINALKKNNILTLCELPKEKKAINNRWIFKCDDLGNIKRRKARLVIKVHRFRSQRFGFDYYETNAPVAHLTILKVVLARDVKNEFLHSDLEEVFMKIPDGVDGTQVCKLNKTLYSLKRAPHAWNSTFDTFMKTLEMKKFIS